MRSIEEPTTGDPMSAAATANVVSLFSSPEAEEIYEAMVPSRTAVPLPMDLTLKMYGMDFPVDAEVPASVCAKEPTGYMLPSKGRAKAEHKRVLRAVARALIERKRGVTGRQALKMFIHGGPGTGKDAIWAMLSSRLGIPSRIFTFDEGTDVKKWCYARKIDSEGTGYDYGALWHALTEGYVGEDGVRRPYLIVFSDIDRATPGQLEAFRLMLDTTSMRVLGPDGAAHDVVPDTMFAFTANSCGNGDERGRMSSNAMDASMLDRMGRFVEFVHMHWDDESRILRGKFPLLAESCPEIFDELGRATESIREAIDRGKLFAELTHRGLCEILAEADDLMFFARGGKVPTGLMGKAFKAWLDRLDSSNKLVAKRLVDSALKGGVFLDEETEDEDEGYY